jgi:hypothetical protein
VHLPVETNFGADARPRVCTMFCLAEHRIVEAQGGFG